MPELPPIDHLLTEHGNQPDDNCATCPRYGNLVWFQRHRKFYCKPCLRIAAQRQIQIDKNLQYTYLQK